MSTAATRSDLTLPLSWRLKRAVMVALLLGLWAPAKIVWELHMDAQAESARYHNIAVTRHLRDQLSQGLTIGVLAGMRAFIADFIWLDTITAMMDTDWFRMAHIVELVTTLQPRAPIFWEMGGWELAWNASVDATQNPNETNPLKRLKAKQYWIERGLDVFKRGLENNPDDFRLWLNTAILYHQRLKDPATAAYYYEMASRQPRAPAYLERAPAEMFSAGNANDPQKEYEAWKALWLRLTPAQRMEKQHTADRLEKEIRRLENKLSIPKEKRVFPN